MVPWDIPADSQPPSCSAKFKKFGRLWRITLKNGMVSSAGEAGGFSGDKSRVSL